MTLQSRTFLCWMLAISLIWLPFSVSADIQTSSKAGHNCHDADSVMTMHAMTVPAVAKNIPMKGMSMSDTQMSGSCCDHCDDGISCATMMSCGISATHVTFITAFSPDAVDVEGISQFLIDRFLRYQSHIITPDIRPPVA